ncbi:MAG: hypothetical protein AAF492_00085 [Verrucomicrobiota bacterium]
MSEENKAPNNENVDESHEDDSDVYEITQILDTMVDEISEEDDEE